MRLIDEEELRTVETQFTDDEGNIVGELEYYDINDVENAPTVEAIAIPEGATKLDVLKLVFPNVEFKNVYCTFKGKKALTEICPFENGVLQGSLEPEWCKEPYKK